METENAEAVVDGSGAWEEEMADRGVAQTLGYSQALLVVGIWYRLCFPATTLSSMV